MRAGGDKRGSYEARRHRVAVLLALYGDGERCSCVHCGAALTASTLTQDRVRCGGSYTVPNLVPACLKCNQSRGCKPLPDDVRRCWRNAVRRFRRNPRRFGFGVAA